MIEEEKITNENTEQQKLVGGAKPGFNLEQILQSERAWEFILLDIVKSENLDPWDIDITKLTTTYLDRIRKMRDLDMRIPARILLAAAILLKMKSETMSLTKSENEMFDELFGSDETEGQREEPEPVPMLDLRLTRQPLRKITLTDLVDALEKALEKSNKERALPHQFNLQLPTIDITEIIEALYNKIYSRPENKIPFSTLIVHRTRNDAVDTLLPLLDLANEEKIDLMQESGLFSEIFIIKTKKKEELINPIAH